MAQAAKSSPGIESTLGVLVAHPTRVMAYVILTERVASPNEICRELDLDVGHVSYHVKKLQDLEVIELVDERPVRGANEHFYRAIKRPYASDVDHEQMTPEQRDSLTRYTLQLHVTDMSRSLGAGTFDARAERSLVRLPMSIDDEGYSEMAALHKEMYERHLEIQAKSAGRLADAKAEGITTVATSMFFELPPRPAP
jgi:DNA-binding transcriptional ArsR family regulator